MRALVNLLRQHLVNRATGLILASGVIRTRLVDEARYSASGAK